MKQLILELDIGQEVSAVSWSQNNTTQMRVQTKTPQETLAVLQTAVSQMMTSAFDCAPVVDAKLAEQTLLTTIESLPAAQKIYREIAKAIRTPKTVSETSGMPNLEIPTDALGLFFEDRRAILWMLHRRGFNANFNGRGSRSSEANTETLRIYW